MADSIADNLLHHSQPDAALVRVMNSIRERGRRWRACNFIMLAAVCLMASASEALAHVKWFCNYNVTDQPAVLSQVISDEFAPLVFLAILIFITATLLDNSLIGDALHKTMNRVAGPIQGNAEILVRATYGAFFVALWTQGEVILTPELKTTATWVSWLQLLIAAGMLWRSTLVLSGAGIIVLFTKALFDYGPFHLMDYPIFLGAAGYFITVGSRRSLFGVQPLDILRYGAAAALMWVSIEKWAYPQWIYPLLVNHPEISFGFNPAFYVKAAGVVEFSLAFALLWTPLARRIAASMLIVMFVSAIFKFGKIDAIGHAPIIVILLAVFADDARTRLYRPGLVPVWYAGAIVGVLATYYAGHASLYGTADSLRTAFGP